MTILTANGTPYKDKSKRDLIRENKRLYEDNYFLNQTLQQFETNHQYVLFLFYEACPDHDLFKDEALVTAIKELQEINKEGKELEDERAKEEAKKTDTDE